MMTASLGNGNDWERNAGTGGRGGIGGQAKDWHKA